MDVGKGVEDGWLDAQGRKGFGQMNLLMMNGRGSLLRRVRGHCRGRCPWIVSLDFVGWERLLSVMMLLLRISAATASASATAWPPFLILKTRVAGLRILVRLRSAGGWRR